MGQPHQVAIFPPVLGETGDRVHIPVAFAPFVVTEECPGDFSGGNPGEMAKFQLHTQAALLDQAGGNGGIVVGSQVPIDRLGVLKTVTAVVVDSGKQQAG